MPLGNSIGAYNVRNWFGEPPQAIGQTTQILEFGGVDYQAFRLLGLRSPVFELESVVDVPTAADGRSQFGLYKAFIGGGPVQLGWNNWNLDNEHQRVIVLDVRIVELKRRIAICGGLFPPSLVDLRCKWQLILVPYFP